MIHLKLKINRQNINNYKQSQCYFDIILSINCQKNWFEDQKHYPFHFKKKSLLKKNCKFQY